MGVRTASPSDRGHKAAARGTARGFALAPRRAAWWPLEAGVVLAGEAERLPLLLAPAGAGALIPAVAAGGGVEALARNHHVDVTRVAVDRDPAALAGCAPARGQTARGHRARQQACSMQDIADRA